MKNVLEYLENTAKLYPKKIAVIDENESCSYEELLYNSQVIGMYLYDIRNSIKNNENKSIAVFMDKSVKTLQIFMGIVYAGGFYTLIDPSFPKERISQILNVLDSDIVITTEENKGKLIEAGYKKKIVEVETLYNYVNESLNRDDFKLDNTEMSTDTDPLYCNFTSGSTGVPKGVLISHRSVIDFIDNFTEIFGISNVDVIGNQAPFDFDVSVKDIFSCFKTGATLVIIPKSYFMFPNKVIDMLEEHKVTTLIWAVSALVLIARLHGLKYKAPESINKILFSGEMMPIKQLNEWRKYYKDAMFVNLYGPTEITCNCMYYIIDKDKQFELEDKIPLGIPFPNEKVFILDENKYKDGNLIGEICVAGTCLALGYYNNEEATKKVFVRNPLNKYYEEMIYKTGDLAYWDEKGNLIFAGRKDFQIKHMGHRIELEEIESALSSVSMIEQVCCFFDDIKNKVVAFYIGEDDKRAIINELKEKVPDYMIPNVWRCVDKLPLNKNGKTDRVLLKKIYREGM